MTTTYPTRTGTQCLICNTPNPEEAILCGSCSAPMAIVHDSIAQQREPQIVSVIGDSNAGKTVYLGFLLDMLAQRAGEFEAIAIEEIHVEDRKVERRALAHRLQHRRPDLFLRPGTWCQGCRHDRSCELLLGQAITPRIQLHGADHPLHWAALA